MTETDQHEGETTPHNYVIIDWKDMIRSLLSGIICFGVAVSLFCFTPKADKKGFGQIVSLMSVVLFLFAIGYFVAWLLHHK